MNAKKLVTRLIAVLLIAIILDLSLFKLPFSNLYIKMMVDLIFVFPSIVWSCWSSLSDKDKETIKRLEDSVDEIK